MAKCPICEKRPRRKGAYCANCESQIEALKKRGNHAKPVKFLTYKGSVVGLFPNGGETVKGQLLKRKPEGLPKGRTIDLNAYCEGYSRDQIKAFKACVLKLAHA